MFYCKENGLTFIETGIHCLRMDSLRLQIGYFIALETMILVTAVLLHNGNGNGGLMEAGFCGAGMEWVARTAMFL